MVMSSVTDLYRVLEVLQDVRSFFGDDYVAGNIEEALEKGRTAIRDITDEMSAMAHVIVEHGVTPGDICRCEECCLVARKMDEAGYLIRTTDRWWDYEPRKEGK